MDKIFIVMEFVEHDLKELMETMSQPFTQGSTRFLSQDHLPRAPLPPTLGHTCHARFDKVLVQRYHLPRGPLPPTLVSPWLFITTSTEWPCKQLVEAAPLSGSPNLVVVMLVA